MLYYTVLYYDIPVVPARGGAEVAFEIYMRPFSSIELACAVRQPSPCVRALCESGVLLHMSHLKLHFAHFSLQSSHSTLHTALFTLHTALLRLHTSHSTLHTSHCALKTPHFTLHTSHFTLHTALFALQTSHSTLHTSQSTLLTSHCLLNFHISIKLVIAPLHEIFTKYIFWLTCLCGCTHQLLQRGLLHRFQLTLLIVKHPYEALKLLLQCCFLHTYPLLQLLPLFLFLLI